MKSVANVFRRYDLVLLALAGGLVLLYVLTAGWGFPLDDSWIHQTYGRNLAQYGEWAFIPGIPSAASTAPLYTLLLAAGYFLGVDYLLWTHLLGALALAAAGILGARMAEKLLPETRFIGIITGAAIIGTWHLIWAAASGMETMLFSTFTLTLLYAAWREIGVGAETNFVVGRRGVIFGVLAALATLTRPEGIMLAGLVGIAMLLARPQGSWTRVAVWSIGAAGGFLICIAPYLLINLQITGGLLPNTAGAKQAQFAPLIALKSYPQRFSDLLIAVIVGGQVVLLPGVLLFTLLKLRDWRKDRRVVLYLVAPLWSVALIALYAARLPMYSQHGRYVIPALPALIVFGVVGTIWLLLTGQQIMILRVVSRVLTITAALLFAYFGLITGPQTLQRDVQIINEEMVASAYWIRDNLDPAQLLAIHDIGAVGYFASRPIFDLAGLVNPEVIPIINDEEPLWEMMRERGAVYLMAFPDQVPGDDVRDQRLCPIYTTGGTASPNAGGANMTVYALAWDGVCPA